MNIQLPRRQQVAAAGIIALFTVMALAGFVSVVYSFWLFWRPGAFLVGGVILCVAGFLGALGKSGHDDAEPF